MYGFSVLYKVCSALPELKTHVMGDALLPYGKHPPIIKQPGVSIRFAANYDQLHIVQISRQVYALYQRLADNILCLMGSPLKMESL